LIRIVSQLTNGSKYAKLIANGLSKCNQRKRSNRKSIAYQNKINHPNYNPFIPLFEEEIKGKGRSVTMDDQIARQRFLKATNDDYHEDNTKTTTPINLDKQRNYL
jgi:hypothetical protein